MISLNIPNVLTIALISLITLAAARWATRAMGIGSSLL
jgi:hypothetical protein